MFQSVLLKLIQHEFQPFFPHNYRSFLGVSQAAFIQCFPCMPNLGDFLFVFKSPGGLTKVPTIKNKNFAQIICIKTYFFTQKIGKNFKT